MKKMNKPLYEFRGKNEEKGWVYGCYLYNPTLKEHKIVTYESNLLMGLAKYIYGGGKRGGAKEVFTQCTYIVDPATVELVDDHKLLLKDRNGKEEQTYHFIGKENK